MSAHRQRECPGFPRTCRLDQPGGLVACLFFLAAGGCSNCLFPGEFVDMGAVRGTALESETGNPISDAPIGVAILRSGEFISFASGNSSKNSAYKSLLPILTNANGSFAIFQRGGDRGCVFPSRTAHSSTTISLGDTVQIDVQRRGCMAQRFLIDISEETVVDPSFPDGVIELKDPILVPPCEQ